MDWVARYEVLVRLHTPKGSSHKHAAAALRRVLIDVVGPEVDLIDIDTIQVSEEEW